MTFLVSFLVQTPQSSPSGLMAQPCCETPGDLWVKNSKNAVINIGWMSLSYQLWPKMTAGQPMRSLKIPSKKWHRRGIS